MYEIMTADEAIYRRYQKMQSPTHLTMISVPDLVSGMMNIMQKVYQRRTRN